MKTLWDNRGSSQLVAAVAAMFAILVLLFIGIAGVRLLNEYATLDSFANQYVRTAAQEGCTSNARIAAKLEELKESTGLHPVAAFSATYVSGSTTKVQYGDTITLNIKLDTELTAFRMSIPATLKLTKTATSEQYWK